MAEISEGVRSYGIQVSEFIEKNRAVLEDSEASYGALSRLCVHAGAVYEAVTYEASEAATRLQEAARVLTEALNDEDCPSTEVNIREKEYTRLAAEHERMFAIQAEIDAFLAEAQERRTHKFQEDGTPKLPASSDVQEEPENSSQPETFGAPIPNTQAERLKPYLEIPRVPWWKRILGVHQEEPSEPRELPTTPSQADSDHEDYEKVLTWYEQNLEVLEKAVAGKQAGEPGEWHQVIDELLDRMGWCDRHMDTIEQRNADMAGSELVSRREGLASRLSELGE